MNHAIPIILLHKLNINISYSTLSIYNFIIFSYLTTFEGQDKTEIIFLDKGEIMFPSMQNKKQ